MRIDPKRAPRIVNSPVQGVLSILSRLFSIAPQPKVQTEAARKCGELLGRHLLNLIRACGELNLSGFHASAVSLFRPLEDGLDCLAAATLIAGAADRWLSGDLKPSEAARLWQRRIKVRSAMTGEPLAEYRKGLRSGFNNFAHCSPLLADWDYYCEPRVGEERLVDLKVNHENLVIVSNAHKIDTYLIAHCDELLDVVELGYGDYLIRHPKVRKELKSLGTRITKLLEEKAGLLNIAYPPEIEGLTVKPIDTQDVINVAGQWKAEWTCGREIRRSSADVTLCQTSCIVKGKLASKELFEGRELRIIEELHGITEDDKLILDGISSDVRGPDHSQVASHEYRLDSFILRPSDDRMRLIGSHSCPLGEGNAVFEKHK